LLLLDFDVEGGGLSRRWQEHCILTAEKAILSLDFHSLYWRIIGIVWDGYGDFIFFFA
jgi:hypothetical protein